MIESTKHISWVSYPRIEATRDSIHKAILQVTERHCTYADLFLERKSTGYLKMARKMVDSFVKGAKNFIIQTDFDADGITSGIIWYNYLARLGSVTIRIPSRDQGHATLVPLLEAMQLNKDAHLVILDNGTNLIAQLLGHMGPHQKALIVDHHQLESPDIPHDDRITIINPHILPGYKLENDLSTAGLSYYLLPESDHKSLILAGLGQLGDVMPLSPLSHQIARQTVDRLQKETPDSLAPIIPKDISVQSLTFQTIPRINSVSRMAHPLFAYMVLSSNAPDKSMFLEIERLNSARQATTISFYEQATKQVTANDIQVIYIPELPPSIAGLIAARIAGLTCKPTLALGNKTSTQLSGSFRSPVDIDLAAIIRRFQAIGIILGGGGHKRAAGLNLDIIQLPRLYQALAEIKVTIQRTYLPVPLLQFPTLTEYYKELEPYGSGSPPPFWGIPYIKCSYQPLYTKADNRHWANQGTLYTPIGNISTLDCGKRKWKPSGIAIGQIDWDTYRNQYILRMEDIL